MITFNSISAHLGPVSTGTTQPAPTSGKFFRITPSSYFAPVSPEARKLKEPERLVVYLEVQGEGLQLDLNEEKFLVAIKHFGLYQVAKPKDPQLSTVPFLEKWSKRPSQDLCMNSVSIHLQEAWNNPANLSSVNSQTQAGFARIVGNPHNSGAMNPFAHNILHQRTPSGNISQTAIKIKQRLQCQKHKEPSLCGQITAGKVLPIFGFERESVSVSYAADHSKDQAQVLPASRATQTQSGGHTHQRSSSEAGISAKVSRKSNNTPVAQISIVQFSFKRVLFDLESPLPLADFLNFIPERKISQVELCKEAFFRLIRLTKPLLNNEMREQQVSVWKDFTKERSTNIYLELAKCSENKQNPNDSNSHILLHLLKQYVIQQSFAVLNSNCSSPKFVGGNTSSKRNNNLLLSFASIEDTIGSIYEKRKLRRRENTSDTVPQNLGLHRSLIRATPTVAVAGIGGALINASTASPRSKLNCALDAEYGFNEILESVLIGVFTCILNDPRKKEVFYSTVSDKKPNSIQLEYGSLIEKSLKFITKECIDSLGMSAESITPEDIRNRLKSLEEISQLRALETFKISGDISVLVNLLFAAKQPDNPQFNHTTEIVSKAIRSNYRFPEGQSLTDGQAKGINNNDLTEGTPRSLAGRELEPVLNLQFPSPGFSSRNPQPDFVVDKRSSGRYIPPATHPKSKHNSGALELPASLELQQPEQKQPLPELEGKPENPFALEKRKYQSNGDLGKLFQQSAYATQPGLGRYNSGARAAGGLGGSPREQEKLSLIIGNSLEKAEKSIKLSEIKQESPHQANNGPAGAGPYRARKHAQPTMPTLLNMRGENSSNKKFPSMNFAGETPGMPPKPDFVPVGYSILKPRKNEHSSGKDLLRKSKPAAAKLLATPNVSVHQQKRKESDGIQLDDMEEEIYACHFDERWHVLRNDLKDSFLLKARYEEVVEDPNLHTQILVLIKDENPRIVQTLVKLHLGKSDGRELAIAVFKEQHKIDTGLTGEYSYRSRSNLDFHYEVFKTMLSQFASFKLIAFTKRLKLLFLHEDKFILGAYEAAVRGLFLSNFGKDKREAFLKEFGENLELMVDLMEEEKHPDRFSMLDYQARATIWNTTRDEEEALADLEEKLTAEQIHGLRKYIYFNNSGTLHNQYYKYRRQKISLDELLIRLDSLSNLYVYRRG